jgi:uncharacterized protein YybS (DUF2232 family)
MILELKFILLCSIAGAILYSLSLTMPLIGGVLSFFSPLPLGYIGLKKDKYNLYVCFLFTVLLVFFAGGKLGVFLYLLQYGVPFLMFFELYYRGFGTINSIIITILSVVTGIVLVILAYNSFNVSESIQAVTNFMNLNFKAVMKSYKTLGVSEKEINTLSENLKNLTYTITRIMPSLMIMFYGSIFFLNLPIMERLTKVKFKNFNLIDFTSPFPVIWGFIISGFGIFLLNKSFIWWILLNVFISTSFIFLIQGFGVVEHWFRKLNYSRLMKNFFYVLILFSQFLLVTIAIIGLFDNWFDFRKIIQSGGTDEGNS